METDNAGGDRKHKSQRMDSEPAGAGYIPMLNADTGYYDISRFGNNEIPMVPVILPITMTFVYLTIHQCIYCGKS